MSSETLFVLPSHCKSLQGIKKMSACEDAMRKMKEKLVTVPVLAYPSFGKPYTVETDASIRQLSGGRSVFLELTRITVCNQCTLP